MRRDDGKNKTVKRVKKKQRELKTEAPRLPRAKGKKRENTEGKGKG